MRILVDTGPLLAYLDKSDQWHRWAAKQFGNFKPPFYTCEAVMTEICFLLSRQNMNQDIVFSLVEQGEIIIKPVFSSKQMQGHVRNIVNTYNNLPASFADACLVCMAEHAASDAKIFTLDNHFNIYRTAGGNPLSLISPAS